MLPLVSSTMPKLTGTRSALKSATSTGSIVFKNRKVGLWSVLARSGRSVGDRGRDVNQVDAAAEAEAFLTRPTGLSRA